MVRTPWWSIAWSLIALAAAADEPAMHGIPYLPDPPPAIDGRLDQWQSVPNFWTIATREHVVVYPHRWTSAKDLSAKVWLGWRTEGLYLAADVTDDRVVQTQRGLDLWKGDHIELYLDAAPELEPQRHTFGPGQMQFGFSPGNLTKTGDPLADIPPEAVAFRPAGSHAEGIRVAAQKSENGYTLEAAIPWSLVDKLAGQQPRRPAEGRPLRIEVAISDTDGAEPVQEKLMTISTAPWEPMSRARPLPAVLASSSGKIPHIERGFDIVGNVRLKPGAQQQFPFRTLAVPAGMDLLLTVKAWLDTPRPGGYTSALRLSVNGQTLDTQRLTNWEREEFQLDGRIAKPAAGELFNAPYAPDFDAANRNPRYALRSGPKLGRFDLRITDLLQSSGNVLLLANGVRPEIGRTLVVNDVRMEVRPPQSVRPKRPAPTGPLPVVVPQQRFKTNYALSVGTDGTIELMVRGEKFRVQSEFSTPQPGWAKGSNRFFDSRRTVQRHDEVILICDTFTNRTAENLPLMQRHRVFADKPWKAVWVGGISPSAMTGASSDPGNPSTYATSAHGGVGLLAVDDVSMVHTYNFSAPDNIGLADNQLVLRPKATHISQWALVPTEQPDYFAFVNAVRRLRGANFTLQGSFAWLRAQPKTAVADWSDRQLADFIRFKGARYVVDTYLFPSYKGRFPHGTAFLDLDWSYLKQQIARRRAVAPESKHLLYMNCFLDVLDEAPARYADARLLGPDGLQADYGKPELKLFVPTAANAFGRDNARKIDMFLTPPPAGFGVDGVYWDEFEFSRMRYTYGDFSQPGGLLWDGVSADIDPTTMKITRLKSALELVSQPFRLAQAQRILQKHILVANGQPHTQTIMQLHFPRFVETGSLSHCASAQLFSPIGLGDHLTERSELDAYHVMLRVLDFGCLYYWYGDLHVVPTHPHLPIYMFPITPLELHEGYILGEERIVTNRSGRFGWGDRSRHEVHVFDDQGRESPHFAAPTMLENNMTFTDLRLPEDYSAAIVKK